ncbi:C1 family peptidase [Candidatus Eisenbacteria bacterium]|uniref:C1 family peptidase n=1 Tax=Eiseniibacteriota bacterium TaxID=2212470 RepID=A0ABV6YKZ7_UNCEI
MDLRDREYGPRSVHELMKVTFLVYLIAGLVSHAGAAQGQEHLRGYVPMDKELIRSTHLGEVDPLPERDLPASWDWRELGGMTPVRNQSACGSGWAFAACHALESLLLITTGVTESISPQQCVACNELGSGCSGGDPHACYELWSWFGAVRSVCNRYEPPYDEPCYQGDCDVVTRIHGYTSVPQTEQALKTAILIHPVAVTIYAGHIGSPFDWYTGGCFVGETGPPNHVVLACGWDDDACGGDGAWLLKNSWGTSWGEAGYMWLKYGTGSFGGDAALLDLWLPPEALIKYREHKIVDDNNGAFEPGETVELSVIVTNYCTGTATDVTGTLRSLTPNVTVLESTAVFTDMGTWESSESQFTVRAGMYTDPGDIARFELEMNCSQSNDTSTFFEFIGPVATIYEYDFEDSTTDWTFIGDWEQGRVRTFDFQWDPDLATSPDSVCGNDLNGLSLSKDGLYESASTARLKTPVLSFSSVSPVYLVFRRWLTCETRTYDRAALRINGTDIWQNEEGEGNHHLDDSWVPVVYDITNLAGGNPSVQIKWLLFSDEYWKFGGWNVDDVKLISTCPWLSDIEADSEPLRLQLQSNPNPFDRTTSFSLAVPSDVFEVSVLIFDAAGRKIRTLHQGRIEAGQHRFAWTGTDDAGMPVPSGTYYCRVQTDHGTVGIKVNRIRR